MNRDLRNFLLGGFVTITLMGTVVFATGVQKNIQVLMNSVNLMVNGKKVNADNIVYNGTTYVPLRTTAEILGKAVVWDPKTNTVNINDKGANSDSTSSYSRTNPAPLGKTQRVKVENILDSYTAEITVKEIIRGEQAWEIIKNENMFNEEPGADEDYILAKINIKAIEIKDDKKLNVSMADFELFSDKNAKYEIRYNVVSPKPSIDTDLFVGAEHDGYVVFTVKKSDKNPKIVYGMDYDGAGGVWFKLQ